MLVNKTSSFIVRQMKVQLQTASEQRKNGIY